MPENQRQRLLFIINEHAGNNKTDWAILINNYFAKLNFSIELYFLPKAINQEKIKEIITSFSPQIVVAVGGDGTIKLVAEQLLQTEIKLGIIPTGSANGLAYELGIPYDPILALDIIVKGFSKKIHTILINKQLCIHLSDIGLNAYGMKKFKTVPIRGMWGYFIAAMKVVWQNSLMEIEMQIANKTMKISAIMVVIANGTSYGSGAIINPIGQLTDHLFEVIVVKKISFREMFKMKISHALFDASKTEIFQTNKLHLHSTKKVHFQIDGDYLGKVNDVEAKIMLDAISIVCNR
jgi:diacylglycerol kinase (ATP)